MSILIKGMKKPKDCYSCPFAHNGWPDEWEMHCLFLDRQVGYFGKKLKVPKDCPLVEVSDPCAQSEQRWIPCKDRLPEEGVDVLISYRYKEGEGDTSHMYIDISSYGTVSFGGHKLEGIKEWGQPFAYFNSNYEVVAWMPLPEPYKEEE